MTGGARRRSIFHARDWRASHRPVRVSGGAREASAALVRPPPPGARLMHAGATVATTVSDGALILTVRAASAVAAQALLRRVVAVLPLDARMALRRPPPSDLLHDVADMQTEIEATLLFFGDVAVQRATPGLLAATQGKFRGART